MDWFFFGQASGMVPDVERIIDSIAQGDQDTVQLLLDSYNTQVTDSCYGYCINPFLEIFIFVTMETLCIIAAGNINYCNNQV